LPAESGQRNDFDKTADARGALKNPSKLQETRQIKGFRDGRYWTRTTAKASGKTSDFSEAVHKAVQLADPRLAALIRRWPELSSDIQDTLLAAAGVKMRLAGRR
jgi:hypothetical protein